MKIEKKHCLLLVILFLASCKAPYAPPPFTLGVALEEVGQKYSANNAIPDMKNGKQEAIKPGDIVMPAESFSAFYNWGSDLRQKLIQCENQPRN